MASNNKFSFKFALTITLLPKHYKLSLDEQYKLINTQLEKILIGDKLLMSVALELTKQMNFHLHTICVIVNPHPKHTLKRQITDMFRNNPVFGFVYYRTMEDEQGWIDYCLKDKVNTEKEGFHTILFDELRCLHPWAKIFNPEETKHEDHSAC